MASLSFEGETHDEIVLKVKRWLHSAEGGTTDTRLTPVEAVERGAELTKDALRVLAAAAPAPMASNEVVKTLTTMGYKATDQTRDAVVAGLDSLEQHRRRRRPASRGRDQRGDVADERGGGQAALEVAPHASSVSRR